MVTLELIRAAVEKNTGVKDITVKSKKNRLPIYRGLYCKLATELTECPLTAIGQVVGVHHASVVYWRETFKDIFITEPHMKDLYRHIKQQIIGARNLVRFQSLEEIDQEAEDIIENMLR